MPVVYDNWERLLQAVLRREQYLEMAHAHSRSTSAASSVSLDFDELSLNSPSEVENVENEGRSSRSDFGPSQLLNDSVNSIENNLRSKGLNENGSKSRNSLITSDVSQKSSEWIEQYEPGVYVTLVDSQDGSRDIKRVRCSRKRFSDNQVEAWWSENRENVYNKYNIRKISGFSASDKAASKTEGVVPQGIDGSKSRTSVGPNEGDANQTVGEWMEEYEPGVYLRSKGLNENGSKSRNSLITSDASQKSSKWIEQYEPGVYITLVDSQDGSRYIKRVRCSRKRFPDNQVEAWWSENRENVYNKYNIRRIYNAANRTEGVVPQGIDGSTRNSVGSVKGDASSSR